MFIRISSPEEIKNIVEPLEKLGFEKSKFSVDEGITKGVATFITPDDKLYIFLSENMMTNNECSSWICHRKEVHSVEELLTEITHHPWR